MENSEEIDDYILNSQGVIWRGNYRQRLPIFWDYGQVNGADNKWFEKLVSSMKMEVLKVLCFYCLL